MSSPGSVFGGRVPRAKPVRRVPIDRRSFEERMRDKELEKMRKREERRRAANRKRRSMSPKKNNRSKTPPRNTNAKRKSKVQTEQIRKLQAEVRQLENALRASERNLEGARVEKNALFEKINVLDAKLVNSQDLVAELRRGGDVGELLAREAAAREEVAELESKLEECKRSKEEEYNFAFAAMDEYAREKEELENQLAEQLDIVDFNLRKIEQLETDLDECRQNKGEEGADKLLQDAYAEIRKCEKEKEGLNKERAKQTAAIFRLKDEIERLKKASRRRRSRSPGRQKTTKRQKPPAKRREEPQEQPSWFSGLFGSPAADNTKVEEGDDDQGDFEDEFEDSNSEDDSNVDEESDTDGEGGEESDNGEEDIDSDEDGNDFAGDFEEEDDDEDDDEDDNFGNDFGGDFEDEDDDDEDDDDEDDFEEEDPWFGVTEQAIKKRALDENPKWTTAEKMFAENSGLTREALGRIIMNRRAQAIKLATIILDKQLDYSKKSTTAAKIVTAIANDLGLPSEGGGESKSSGRKRKTRKWYNPSTGKWESKLRLLPNPVFYKTTLRF